MNDQSDRRLVVAVDRRFPNDHSFLEGVMEKRVSTRLKLLWVMRPKFRSGDIIFDRWHRSSCMLLPTRGKSGDASLLYDYWFLFLRLPKLWAHLKDFDPDAVFVRNDPVYLTLALAFARRKSIPVFFQLSHLKEEELLERAQEQTWPRSLLTTWKAKISRKIRNYGMARCDVIFPISEAMKELLLSRSKMTNEFYPIPLGVDSGVHDDFAASPDGLPESYVLHVGTLASSRRPEVIVDAFVLLAKQFPDLSLVFVGGGSEPGARQVLQQYVSESPVSNRIRFIADVPRQSLPGYIRHAACCLSVQPMTPVFRTISPTKLMEYLQFGAKVVATRGIADQENILQASDGGRLVDFQKESIANGIKWILDNPQLAFEMAARGQAYVLQNRNYDDLASRLSEKLYQRIDAWAAQ